jgi:hypothetical protein
MAYSREAGFKCADEESVESQSFEEGRRIVASVKEPFFLLSHMLAELRFKQNKA